MKIGRVLLLLMLVGSASLSAGGQYVSKTTQATATKEANADQAEEITIPGIVIERESGDGFLGLELVDYNYKLTFYGLDKKPRTADYQRALLRWDRTNRPGSERYMLNLSTDGKSLVSPRYVRPPYNYRLIITLISDDPETESETHVVWFRL